MTINKRKINIILWLIICIGITLIILNEVLLSWLYLLQPLPKYQMIDINTKGQSTTIETYLFRGEYKIIFYRKNSNMGYVESLSDDIIISLNKSTQIPPPYYFYCKNFFSLQRFHVTILQNTKDKYYMSIFLKP